MRFRKERKRRFKLKKERQKRKACKLKKEREIRSFARKISKESWSFARTSIKRSRKRRKIIVTGRSDIIDSHETWSTASMTHSYLLNIRLFLICCSSP